jgi:hypothetical protein
LPWKDSLRRWGKKLGKASRMEWEVEPPLKKFVPDNANLKVLESYGKVLGDDYCVPHYQVNQHAGCGDINVETDGIMSGIIRLCC